ncbi:type I 3-dehydroquinate dehydratase [Brachybacterium phenoliresistens]|uniref:3-dehydroquinate dehydratase n=1 Tax=Brachybacterium phenoliresistens TaxID=396014 RepID=Z9JX91_9MICO|nr:type I 3-dehydroquinate dehydratase [Brachybacterium phenoliresistens]EWS82814.1 3-dehydroquinate dehydratase [Brachybacterium phenoliresistens]
MIPAAPLDGSGPTAVIVPVTAADPARLAQEVRTAADAAPDLLEWRADPLLAAGHAGAVASLAQTVREAAGDIPLLVTVRTRAEGGAADLTGVATTTLHERLLATGAADLLDVEMLTDPTAARASLEAAHRAGVRVVGSHHRFDATPDEDEMVAALHRIATAGADVAKLAVMPHSPQDVLALMRATLRAHEELPVPVVTMSMGPLGALSRLSGPLTGSAATFATVGAASAPGQLTLAQVRAALAALAG